MDPNRLFTSDEVESARQSKNIKINTPKSDIFQ